MVDGPGPGSGLASSVARSPDSSAARSSSSRRPDKHSRVTADPRRSPGDCTFNSQTPTRRCVRDWDAVTAVILLMGTTCTDRLTKPLRNSNAPPTTEYFLTSHCAMAITMASANRATLTHHGAPPKIVTTRNGIACRNVLAGPGIRWIGGSRVWVRATPSEGSDIVGEIGQAADPITKLVSLSPVQATEPHRASRTPD